VLCHCRQRWEKCRRSFGDGIVPVNGALGRHEDPGLTLSFARQWVGYGMNHWDLLSRPTVYEQIKHWIAAPRQFPKKGL
jgi:hypothetical protein